MGKELRLKTRVVQVVTARVQGEIKRLRDLRGGRWSWTSKLAHKRSSVGRWSWAAKVKLLSLRVVPQQLCNGHCPCDSAHARQLKQQLRSALVAGQWRGDTALTLPLFWRRSTVSPVFFGRYSRSSLHSFVPFPPVPVLNKPSPFCGRKAECTLTAPLRTARADYIAPRPVLEGRNH